MAAVPSRGAGDFLAWINFASDPDATKKLRDATAAFVEADSRYQDKTQDLMRREAAVTQREKDAEAIMAKRDDIATAAQQLGNAGEEFERRRVQIESGFVTRDATLKVKEDALRRREGALIEREAALANTQEELNTLRTDINARIAKLDAREAKMRAAIE